MLLLDKSEILSKLKNEGFLKIEDRHFHSFERWGLDELVEDGILCVEKVSEGSFFFKKKYLIYTMLSSHTAANISAKRNKTLESILGK